MMIHRSARYDPASSVDAGRVRGMLRRERSSEPSRFSGMARIVLAVAYFPRPFARGVSSALWRFTSVFGMGTGGSTTL